MRRWNAEVSKSCCFSFAKETFLLFGLLMNFGPNTGELVILCDLCVSSSWLYTQLYGSVYCCALLAPPVCLLFSTEVLHLWILIRISKCDGGLICFAYDLNNSVQTSNPWTFLGAYFAFLWHFLQKVLINHLRGYSSGLHKVIYI